MRGDPGIPSNWYLIARRDLEKARRDLTQGDVPYALILLQQAAEKACKGWLLSRGWNLVKVHDLVFLLGEMNAHGLNVDWFAMTAAVLSKEYFAERYVSWDSEPTPHETEARTLLHDVERLFEALDVP
ncbi:MAG: HEPN domain-containing protein [Acidobacteria bacterium]|nr:HEPN domain-containing protein [Acidobacteriota bacterium]